MLVLKNPPNNAGDVRDMRCVGSILGSGRCPGGGHSYPLQYSCLESPMDRRAWQATVCGITGVGHHWSDLAHLHTFISLSIYFWLHWIFFAGCVGFPLDMASRSYFSLQYADFSLQRLLLLPSSGSRALRLQQLCSQSLEHNLNSCDRWVQLIQSMWDLLGLRMETKSHIPAGRSFTTEPPGKPFLGLTSSCFPLCSFLPKLR